MEMTTAATHCYSACPQFHFTILALPSSSIKNVTWLISHLMAGLGCGKYKGERYRNATPSILGPLYNIYLLYILCSFLLLMNLSYDLPIGTKPSLFEDLWHPTIKHKQELHKICGISYMLFLSSQCSPENHHFFPKLILNLKIWLEL